MKLKMTKNILRVTREDEESAVFSSAAFFHRLMMELKDYGIKSKTEHNEETKANVITGDLPNGSWLLFEDIDVSAKKVYNNFQPVTCILSASVKTIQDFRRRVNNLCK